MKKQLSFWRTSMLIFTFLLMAIISPQIIFAETLCQQHVNDSYLIVTGGTPASNGLTSGQTGVKIWLKGNLTIDQQFTMDGWTVRADPGVSIVVNPGVGLVATHSVFFCCMNLWKGIVLGTNSKLLMHYCRVEDAQTAIYSSAQGCTLSLYSTVFDRNKYGIYHIPPSTAFLNMANFENNTFSCTSPRNDGPSKSDAGIYAYNTLSSFFDGFPNSFINQMDGIRLLRSRFRINGCKFSACDNGIYLTNQSNIRQKGLGKMSTTPSFINCNYAINAVSSDFSATDNYVVNFHHAFFSTGLSTSSINVSNNRIENTLGSSYSSGVRLEGTTSFIDLIKDNLFVFDNSGAYCVIVPDKYNNSNELQIVNNDFELTSIGEIAEVRLMGCAGKMTFQDNTLYPIGEPGGWGCHFHNAALLSSHMVEGNNIVGALANHFYAENGVLNFCNNTSGIKGTGFEFMGNCLGTVLSESHVGSHSIGVLIGDRIGQQDIRGNCWSGINNYSDKAVRCNGDNPNFSKFTVDGTIPCHYPVNSIHPPSLVDPNGTGYNPCTGSLVENINGLDLQIANGGISQTTTSPLEIWDAQRYLFRKLYLHPELMPSGSQAASFYQAQAAGKIGEFHQAELAVRAAGVMPGGLMTQHEAALDGLFTKLQEVVSLNGQLVTQPNSTTLQAKRDAAIAAALLYANDLESVRSLADNAIAAQTNAALSALTALSCNQVWQQNEKTVRYLSLLCTSQGARDFTETELDKLQDIAEQCPEQGGDFVLQARALVMYAEGQGFYEPSPNDYDCINPLPLKKPKEGGLSDMTIVPNPASEYILVKFTGPAEGELRVVDMQGRQVLEAKVIDGDNNLFFDTSLWPVGLYYFQFLENGRTATSGRFVISR